jgi:hypothetical protein
MKTILQVVALFALLTTVAYAQEPVKARMAVVRIQSIINNGNLHEKVRMVTCDKDTLAAMKKLISELKELKKQVVDAEDDGKLNELGQRAQFLNQKLSILKQHAQNSNPNVDMQAVIRKFIVEKYKGKYTMIMQLDQGMPDRLYIWKAESQIDDITDEVGEKFREYLDASLRD